MWKPTPNNATAKTAWAPNVWRPAAVCAVAITLFGMVLFAGRNARIMLHAPHKTFSLSVADTDAARQKGLGGRGSLPANQGMLFVFARPAKECFWMKDMHFALDIIWLDQSKRVLAVRSNVSPASFPKTFCTADTKYVVEINAGQAAPAGIVPGQKMSF